MAAAQGSIHVMVSVDWEGRSLEPRNLRAMSEFRRDYPQVNLLQYLNPAYFFKPGVDVHETRDAIWSVLRDGDEHGLHLHGWKRFIEACGIEYQSSPHFEGYEPYSCSDDCGHGVPIAVYSVDELRRMIDYSQRVHAWAGFDRAVDFRTGGWVSTENVQEALAAEGFKTDSSAVPPHLVNHANPSRPLWRWVGGLWRDVQTHDQPWQMHTRFGELVQIPDNGALADYVTGDDMFQTFLDNVRLWEQDPSGDVYVMIGFHQETADSYIDRVRRAIDLIEAYAARHDLPLVHQSYPLGF